MPTPKSPLDKPSSSSSSHSHSRRPSLARRSSSEKSSGKSSKHASKSGGSTTTKSKAKDAEHMSDASIKHGEERGNVVNDGLVTSTGQITYTQSAVGDGGAAKRENAVRDSAEEIERLKQAMNAQLLLKAHREKLAQKMDSGDLGGDAVIISVPGTTKKSKVSPIHEEAISPTPSFDGAFASPIPSALETASTESARTIRGGMTPAAIPRTPSYPFPSMRPPRQSSWTGHRPFTALSPTVNPTNYAGGTFAAGHHHDEPLSGSATPGSAMNFHPTEQSNSMDASIFETPNLYDISLRLSYEPGLDAWWTTVVQLLKELYKAERITLAVPADSTDIENVPWGQKATYSALEEDRLSLVYLPRGSSLVPGSSNDTSDSSNGSEELPNVGTTSLLRPAMLSRHSFTAYEQTKREPEPQRPNALRPVAVARAKSYLTPRPEAVHRGQVPPNVRLNLRALEEHEEFEELKPRSADWEEAQEASRENKGRIFPVLQALDYEADPLLDSGGVLRVLERGKVIALTRDYPYLDDPKTKDENVSGDEGRGGTAWATGVRQDVQDKIKSGKGPEVNARMAALLSGRRPSRNTRLLISEKGKSLPVTARGADQEQDRPLTPRYEEYEQAPPSPWAQSPAPSPAVRLETADNPFFAGIPIDEETFNPRTDSSDYATSQPVEAIGTDRSWTVLHVPLIHPLLSKPVQSFRLDAAAMESRSRVQGSNFEKVPTQAAVDDKPTPIAILSILTPVIPYPANLRHSLSHLSSHLATSFSLCRHYSNLETELAGLTRKRPAVQGFGAMAPKGSGESQLFGAPAFMSPSEEHAPQLSLSTLGSITSSSEYSGVSRSTTDSPLHTPNLDASHLAPSRLRNAPLSSPSLNVHGEGYFEAKGRPPMSRDNSGSGASNNAPRKVVKESSSLAHSPQSNSTDTDRAVETQGLQGTSNSVVDSVREKGSTKEDRGIEGEGTIKNTQANTSQRRNTSPDRRSQLTSPRRQTFLTGGTQPSAPSERQHTQLHSYGADFGATFQSLPSTTSSSKPGIEVKTPPRTGSLSSLEVPQVMPPPSDRLKGLMLDSLPAHVFVALPVTGEIVWVNNRYLTYRGQTVPELHINPWNTIHPDEREEYLKAWGHAVRTGEQFSKQVRIRRFDGNYRWFYTRAVGYRDIRGVIVQWYGSHMDIHDQHIAEVKAARQEEIEASEAKHRQLANLIPQIIFAATEDEGVTFANEQWLSYTGQGFEEALGLGFLDFIHPEDLAKCSLSPDAAASTKPGKPGNMHRMRSQNSSAGNSSSNRSSNVSDTPTEATAKAGQNLLSRHNSSSSGSFNDFPIADLQQLARSGVISSSTDGNGRLSYSTEIRLRSKTGEYRWHLVRCVEVDNISLGSGDGSWFGACTDINDHKLLETKLKDAMDSKTKFLSNMSHEIRTPLIGISGMVNFLQDTTLNDEQMDYANTIHASAKSLLNIINDILDLSKVDAGMMKLSYDWFHPRSLVEEVNEMVCTMAITKRLELNYIVDNDVPEMVRGDKFRMRQVLLNVIGNAIKFTSVGEVFSRCRVVKSPEGLEEDDIMLEFSVIDTGRGFSKQEAELMFKPFSQIDGSSTRQHGGSGLGLVISRTLVELHGGKMEGSAVPDEGSTFVFTAKFGMATAEDHPEPALTPHIMPPLLSRTSSASAQLVTAAAAKRFSKELVDSPKGESNPTSPAVLSSSASTSSSRSIQSHSTQRSARSSTTNLSHFGEAARSGSQDATTMNFTLPERLKSPTFTPSVPFGTQGDLYRTTSGSDSEKKSFRPPMYSILLICPQKHSREATTQHIENTLPNDVPHQITPLSSIVEARDLIDGEDPINFTHIVLNLGVAEEIVSVVEMIRKSITKPTPALVILSDPVERQEVIKLGAAYDYEQLAKDNAVTFIYKPVKPSRFAVVFDPEKERDLSTDRNRFSAQQQVASQKQNYLDVAKRLGNKGFKVLLVEDNLVNQKVLLKYLSKIGLAVELALDGVECVEKVFAQPYSHYSLILCDLHMPRKDGYQTCREIRSWEKKNKYPAKPIIALSANVMADVLEKCVQAGFSNYVTKPVDFKTLSEVMGSFLDPGRGGGTAGDMK